MVGQIGKLRKGDCKMEGIGIKKEIDKLGRLCIPKEMRDRLEIEKEVTLILTPEGILIKNDEYVLIKKCELGLLP